MSRIQKLFQDKSNRVLNVYCTAGYPELNDTLRVMESLQEAGVDLIELGMPYSDPLADGPVIQASSMKAIQNGMTLKILFNQLKDFRKRISIPVILMGYMNTILQYGFEDFCKDCAATGIDGLILPDLPIYEFETEYGAIIKKYGLDFIFLVTPETASSRIQKLDQLSSGFLYAVSSSSTTGKNKDVGLQQEYFLRLREMNLNNPVLVGFGIHNKTTFDAACLHTNGAIIGSAFIQALGSGLPIEQVTKEFITTVIA